MIRTTETLEIIDMFFTMPYLLPPSQNLLIYFCGKSTWVVEYIQSTGPPGSLPVEDPLQSIHQGQVISGRQGRTVLSCWLWKLRCNLAYRPKLYDEPFLTPIMGGKPRPHWMANPWTLHLAKNIWMCKQVHCEDNPCSSSAVLWDLSQALSYYNYANLHLTES